MKSDVASLTSSWFLKGPSNANSGPQNGNMSSNIILGRVLVSRHSVSRGFLPPKGSLSSSELGTRQVSASALVKRIPATVPCVPVFCKWPEPWPFYEYPCSENLLSLQKPISFVEIEVSPSLNGGDGRDSTEVSLHCPQEKSLFVIWKSPNVLLNYAVIDWFRSFCFCRELSTVN